MRRPKGISGRCGAANHEPQGASAALALTPEISYAIRFALVDFRFLGGIMGGAVARRRIARYP
ncbi:MAG: hypothetical protein JWN86_4692 [Planctomycetota bacterium]|nr:hypothetical protein [Planctomycetota bacterium]